MNYEGIKDLELLRIVGGKLKELRLEQNMKQKELAEKAGLSMFSISQMETGHNTSMQSLIQYLRALGKLDILAPLLSPEGENNNLVGRQRVSRVAPLLSPKEEVLGYQKLGTPNNHNVINYSLPEDEQSSMAAEPEPTPNY